MMRPRLLLTTRAWLARAYNVPHEARTAIVARMLEGHARNAPAYWLQLGIAMALATLGLALNGTAVVIGAMLVSPLMSPIVELGMGLAVGSPLLAIRSAVRTLGSVVIVIVGSALITAALPFHEVTQEIAARASPTALDLLIAVFCALAAAFTTLRGTSDGAASAAGTAVAIALVPPLCVVGFGLGAHEREIAAGALLLFTANLCAILAFTVLTFWVFAFNLVDIHRLEATRLEDTEPLSRSVRWGRALFGSRYGRWLRLLVPIALIVLVWMPLTRALHQVTWQVRTRSKILRLVHALPLADRAVRSSVLVEHGTVRVRLAVVARPAEAHALRATLVKQIAGVDVPKPDVEVVTVPDLAAMADLVRSMREPVPQVVVPRPSAFSELQAEVKELLSTAWPRAAAGELRHWRLEVAAEDALRLEVTHVGSPLGEAGESLLASLAGDRLDHSVKISDVALPKEALTAALEDGARWLPSLASAVAWLRADPLLGACVLLPELRAARSRGSKRVGTREGDLAAVYRAAHAELAKIPPAQVTIAPGERWSVQLQPPSCGPSGTTEGKRGDVPPTATP